MQSLEAGACNGLEHHARTTIATLEALADESDVASNTSFWTSSVIHSGPLPTTEYIYFSSVWVETFLVQ